MALAGGLVLNVLLNLVLLPRLGLEGAVLSTAAANALMLGLICLFNRRLGFPLDDGAKLVLVLPMVVCLGPWVAIFAIAGDRGRGRGGQLGSFRRKKSTSLPRVCSQYGKRFGLYRLYAAVATQAEEIDFPAQAFRMAGPSQCSWALPLGLAGATRTSRSGFSGCSGSMPGNLATVF